MRQRIQLRRTESATAGSSGLRVCRRVAANRSSVPCRGRINPLWLLLLSGASLIIILTATLLQTDSTAESQAATELTMYCAAGFRGPVEQIAQEYEAEFGVRVNLQFGGSNTLLSQIEVNQHGSADIFLAADETYVRQAVAKGLAAEILPIAHVRPVLAVSRGNPKHIRVLDDLLRPDITLTVPDPDQAACGAAVRKALERLPAGTTNRWQQLVDQVTRTGVFKPTVTDSANDLKMGVVDAGILWDFLAMAPGYRDRMETVALEEFDGEPGQVSVAILNSSRQATAALRFGRYLTARDRGLREFQKSGLRVVEGDEWAEQPTVTFFCGAVNRRAIEGLVEQFSKREGVVVNTIYDGCGTLTGRMRGIDGQRIDLGFPDVYMACDLYHLENVKDWFQEAATVSSAEIVIAVPRGSTKVQGLADLLRPGIRVAIGQPEQCTIGALTRRMLQDKGLYDQLKEKQVQPGEVVVEKPSSALLVPDVTTGHVDAAIAYITDVLANRDRVDIVRVDSDLKRAVQPLSVSRTSAHKYLVRRLYRLVTSSPEAFRSVGFEFQYKAAPGESVPESSGSQHPDAVEQNQAAGRD